MGLGSTCESKLNVLTTTIMVEPQPPSIPPYCIACFSVGNDELKDRHHDGRVVDFTGVRMQKWEHLNRKGKLSLIRRFHTVENKIISWKKEWCYNRPEIYGSEVHGRPGKCINASLRSKYKQALSSSLTKKVVMVHPRSAAE